MSKIHTHYDNLKVTRSAPPEVIRAAYKSLAQKYHPDRNPNNLDASRIMSIINTSYSVLSDPIKRDEHDKWIDEQFITKNKAAVQKKEQPPPSKIEPESNTKITFTEILVHILRNWIVYGIIGAVLWVLIKDDGGSANNSEGLHVLNDSNSSANKENSQLEGSNNTRPSDSAVNQSKGSEKYSRPDAAPNGRVWPKVASYIVGFRQLNTTGLSSVTVDNKVNDSDVYVKLVLLNSTKTYAIRHVFIPAYSSFKINNVSPGNYDIRYRNLSNGKLSRSESFNLNETQTEAGTEFSNITLTLYKVQNGNMKTYDIKDEEF